MLVYEFVRHSVIHDYMDMDTGNVVAALLVLFISFVFSQLVFGWISNFQTRLERQNQKLEALNKRVKELAVLEERGRLSREIHDGVAQLLACALLKADVAEAHLQAGNIPGAEKELEQLRNACNEAYGDVREVISGLRPEVLEQRDFITVLSEMLEKFTDNTDIKTRLDLEGFDDNNIEKLFPSSTRLQLARVIQESLSNIRKHSKATSAVLRLRLTNFKDGAADSGGASDPLRPITVTINDNGCGFDTRSFHSEGQHFGQIIMRERVESLGGTLEVLSEPDNGTVVKISLPLPFTCLEANRRKVGYGLNG